MNLQVRNTKRSLIKFSYMTLVEVEFLFSLFAAYWFGAENYWLTVLFVIISLVMGYGTSLMYWYLIEHTDKPL